MDPLLVLVGPTASGKTRASLAVAGALDAEIVSLDSMLLYRGMDIGTDKPGDTGGVPHHLVDLLDPSERFDVRQYLARADHAIAEIRGRGRRVLVVGGTGLYLMGLLKGLFEGAPRDDAFRAAAADEDLGTLYARLGEVDPETAGRVNRNDRRRITRALEVHAATGRPLSELQRQFDGPDRYEARLAGLQVDRATLKRRIEKRVDDMLAEGLVEEVRGLSLGPTAAQAVGYKEVLGYIEGAYDLAEARRLIVSNTVRLSRRQSTWFKRFGITWFDGQDPGVDGRLAHFFLGTTSA